MHHLLKTFLVWVLSFQFAVYAESPVFRSSGITLKTAPGQYGGLDNIGIVVERGQIWPPLDGSSVRFRLGGRLFGGIVRANKLDPNHPYLPHMHEIKTGDGQSEGPQTGTQVGPSQQTSAAAPRIGSSPENKTTLPEANSKDSSEGTPTEQTGTSVLKTSFIAGGTAGLATMLYRGLFLNSEASEKRTEVIAMIQAEQAKQGLLLEGINDSAKELLGAIDQNKKLFQRFSDVEFRESGIFGKDPYIFGTRDGDDLARLRENRDLLNSIITFDNKCRESAYWGLEMNRAADESFAANNRAEGETFLLYAQLFADLAIGWFPVTGVARDLYELFTGKNLLTGEKLSDLQMTFAAAGVLTFGFADEIGRGITAFQKFSKSKLIKPFFNKVLNNVAKWSTEFKAFRRTEEYRSAVEAAPDLIAQIEKTEAHHLNHYVDLVNETSGIRVELAVPDRLGPVAQQQMSKEALDLYHEIKTNDRLIYRNGAFPYTYTNNGVLIHDPGSSMLLQEHNPQYWAGNFRHVEDPDFASKYGARFSQSEWTEIGHVLPDKKFITRPADGYQSLIRGVPVDHPGGELEVVVEIGGVRKVEFKDWQNHVQ